MPKTISDLTRDEYLAIIAFYNLREAIECLDNPAVSSRATDLVEQMLIDHRPESDHPLNTLYANIIAAIKEFQSDIRK